MWKRESRSIRRGDIYYADLNPIVGCEQGGTRPVVIVQNNVGNRHSPTVIAAAITSQTKKNPLPTHVRLSGTPRGLPQDSVVLLEQLRTIDRGRLRRRAGSLELAELMEIDRALAVSVGLSDLPHKPNTEKGGLLMSEKKKCFVYSRVDAPAEPLSTIYEQEKALRDLAAQLGYRVEDTACDLATGQTLQRPGVKQLLAAARERRFHILLVKDLGRISRNWGDTLGFLSYLYDNGIDIHTAHDGLIDVHNEFRRFYKAFQELPADGSQSTYQGMSI